METLPGRLGTLTARDIMNERLVVLQQTDTIEHAASLFRDLRISGAPVVNAEGVAVGLLSVTDIVPAVAARMSTPPVGELPISREDEWEAVCGLLTSATTRQTAGAHELVGSWMSRRLNSVREETPIVEIARQMCDGHRHRVVVVDFEGKLRGIVSTMDVLAALVTAADEVSR